MPHIAVIGAGITGATTAYALTQRGYQVTLIEQHRYAAMETSFANGGQLSASNAEVWNSWSTVLKGLRWMLRPDAPLLMNPAPSLHKYGWLAEFIGNIRHHRANTIATTRMAVAARQYLFEIADRESIEFDHVRRGLLHIYHDEQSWQQAGRGNRLLMEAGLDRRRVSPLEVAEIEPALKSPIKGGYYTPSDTSGDIHKFTTGLVAACQRHGAKLLFEYRVASVPRGDAIWIECRDAQQNRVDLSADAVVVCAGTASRQIGSMFGDRINVYPVKGYSITVHLDDVTSQAAAPWVSLLDESAKIVTSRLGPDRFRIAGTAEFNGFNRDIRADRIRPLVKWVQTFFPSVSTRRVTPWAGLRPMMPDMMPRVGRGRSSRVFYNTGHGHLGWTLSAATAELIANEVDLELGG